MINAIRKLWSQQACRTSLIMGSFAFYSAILINIFNSMGPEILTVFSAEEIGILFTFFFIAQGIFFPFAGALLDTVDIKKIILTAIIVCAIGIILFAFATHFFTAMTGLLITATGACFNFAGPIRYASFMLDKKNVALIFGLIMTMSNLGGIMTQVPVALLVDTVGKRLTAVIVTTLLTPLFFYIISAHTKNAVVQSLKNNSFKLVIKKSGKNLLISAKNLQNWLCGIFAGLSNITTCIFGAVWGNIYLMGAHYLSHLQASAVCTMIFTGLLIGAPCVGWFSDKVNNRKMFMLIGTFMSLCVTLVITSFSFSFTALLLLFFLYGISLSLQTTVFTLIKKMCPPQMMGSTFGLISAISVACGGLTQLAFGKLIDVSNGYDSTNFLLQIIFFIGFIVSLLIKDEKRDVWANLRAER